MLEKEQYRSALQRTARALKREQGKHMANLRQELEQLKIEYLARYASGNLPIRMQGKA